ncbi:hypothetical protein MVEN_00279100 [Mycena venus]|uniref:DUF6534 domain-containing protein n=1 Tax=Mycena venus TaxID=2733690 RepID=A0A8H6Z224_9AGAR|nr:hypothetical protein MVEN_00279100 [Mycena venus]
MTLLSPGFTWDISVAADLLLQGIIYSQLTQYFMTSYKRDVLPVRCFVCGLALATTLKSGWSLYCMWALSRAVFEDDPLIALAKVYRNDLLLRYNVAIVALVVFYVQLYFCTRLYLISRNKYVVAVVATAMLAALVSAFVAAATTAEANSKHWLLTMHLSFLAAGDFFLTGTIVFFLLRQSKDVHPRTAGILTALVRLTFQSAALGAGFAIINLIFNVVSGITQAPLTSGWKFGAITVDQILPKIYAVSAMWTLNWRAEAKLWNDDDVNLNLSLSISGMGSDGTSTMTRPKNGRKERTIQCDADVERGSIDTMQFANPRRNGVKAEQQQQEDLG